MIHTRLESTHAFSAHIDRLNLFRSMMPLFAETMSFIDSSIRHGTAEDASVAQNALVEHGEEKAFLSVRLSC